MTTIAYRDGLMAADTTAYLHRHTCPSGIKIAKGINGTLYGVAGNAARCSQFIDAVHKEALGEEVIFPMPRPTDTGNGARDESDFYVLIVHTDGRKRILTAYGEENHDRADYIALGADAAVAYGAFYAGAGAVMALNACARHGVSSFSPDGPDVLRHTLTA